MANERAMGFQIERGSFGTVSLDGLGFIVLGLTPEAMGKGNRVRELKNDRHVRAFRVNQVLRSDRKTG
jgi:hypothetical protein